MAKMLVGGIAKAPPVTRQAGRLWTHTLPVALIGASVLYGLFRLWIFLHVTPAIASDHDFVMGQVYRILHGGPFYEAWELTQPIYPGTWADLYPPPTVWLLFVPMSFLPAILWWVIPLTIIVAIVVYWRPSLWGCALIAVCTLVWPHTWTVVQLGNPAMWIAMFVALGTVFRWPAAFVVLKPTVLVAFALLGVRSRWFYVAGFALGLVSLAMIPAWLDYLRVLHNLSGFDLLYAGSHVPVCAIPVIAWLTRREVREASLVLVGPVLPGVVEAPLS